MKGFIVFNNKTGTWKHTHALLGTLIYNKYYNAEQKLSKEEHYENQIFDKQDPLKIASQFYALIKMTDIMFEEYKEDYPDALEKDPKTVHAFQ